jgi:hypothetical protein
MKDIINNVINGILQAVGWGIGTVLCGFAFIGLHLLIWPVLILIFPITIYLFWRHPQYISLRWERIRKQIWEWIQKQYGYTHATITIEAPEVHK